jgi:hypothetical protein
MRNYILLILTLITLLNCTNKGEKNNNEKIVKTESVVEKKSTEKQDEQTAIIKTESKKQKNEKNINWKHPEFFEFKNYKEYRISDTIQIDLNGNGIMEKIYFENKNCPKLIIKEKGHNLISIGCGKEEYKGFPNAIGWVNLWCIVYDKETFEVIVQNGELIGEEKVNLERPSIYVGKEEAGGGIITYNNGELYWIHQSD